MERPFLSVIAMAYKYYPIIAPSMLAQTDPSWELIVYHDGINAEYAHWIASLHDGRISLVQSPIRNGKWGHPNRADGIRRAIGQYVVCSNADNYYTPNFVTDMRANIVRGGYDAAVCDMLHSHYNWAHMTAQVRYCSIDCGAFVVKREIAQEVGWPWLHRDADWSFIEACTQKSPFVGHVQQTLFCHN